MTMKCNGVQWWAMKGNEGPAARAVRSRDDRLGCDSQLITRHWTRT